MNRQGMLISAALVLALLLAAGIGWYYFVNKPSATGVLRQAARDVATRKAELPAEKATSEKKAPTDKAAAKRSDAERTGAAATSPEKKQAAETRPEPTDKAAAGEQHAQPAFDIVRVSPDGMVVMAGRAAPGARVDILLDGRVVASVKADERGEWAFNSDKPLFVESHQLALRAAAQGEQPRLSRQTLTVSMKPAREGGTPLVLLATPDEPSRVLQQPQPPRLAQAPEKTTETPEPQAGAPATAETATAEQAGQDSVAPGQEIVVEPAADLLAARRAGAEQMARALRIAMRRLQEQERTTPQSAESPATAGQPAPRTLVLNTVDYDEAGDIFFTGRSEAGAALRLYVDNRHLADVQADEQGRWEWRGKARIAPGRHDLRIDRLTADGKVQERIELPFVRATPRALAEARKPAKGADAAIGDRRAAGAEQKAARKETDEMDVARLQQHLRQQAELEENAGEAARGATVATTPETTVSTPAADEAAAKGAGDSSTSAAAGEDAASASPGAGYIVVQPGNNLWNISRVIYGKGVRYTTIYEANRDQIRNPDLIYPGQVFTAPGLPPKRLRIDPRRRQPASPEELRQRATLR